MKASDVRECMSRLLRSLACVPLIAVVVVTLASQAIVLRAVNRM